MSLANVNNDMEGVTVRIIEQPKSTVRFRYPSERRCDYVVGESTNEEIVTCPTIEIVNSKSAALVLVSCVSKDPPYSPHPYEVECEESDMGSAKGIHCIENPAGKNRIEFPNLRIRCIKVTDMYQALTRREQLKVDPFLTGFKHKNQPRTIDGSSVRLCFQVFLKGSGGRFNIGLNPVLSHPINNKKSSSDLRICWISHYSATVTGGVIMCLLCEGLVNQSVEVRFFDEKSGWEVIADPVPPWFYKKAALIFSSPQFYKQDIDNPVQIKLHVRRLLDQEISETVDFTILPLEIDDHNELKRKRKKRNETPRNLVERYRSAEISSKSTNQHITPLLGQVKRGIPPAPVIPLPCPSPKWTFSSEASNLLDEPVPEIPFYPGIDPMRYHQSEDVDPAPNRNYSHQAEVIPNNDYCHQNPVTRSNFAQGYFLTDD